MYQASQTGMPAMRPLFLEFPDDVRCYTDRSLTFLFGPALLVANVVEKGAYWVSVDGERIPRFLVRDNWERAQAGWYYNLSDRTVWIKCPKPAKDDFDIVVSTEKFDLIGMADEV